MGYRVSGGASLAEEPLTDLTRIYEAYHDRVVAYAARLLGPDAADDVAQEVFVKVGRSLQQLEDLSKLTSWIYAITLNTVRDAARRTSGSRRLLGLVGPEREDGNGVVEPQVPDTDGRSPEEAAIRNEMVACYLDYVRQLPPSYYQTFVLSELEDLSNEEIARRLALSVGTVKIRLHRARARLHSQLRRDCSCYTNERGELMGAPKRP